jgi:hypothetical protein
MQRRLELIRHATQGDFGAHARAVCILEKTLTRAGGEELIFHKLKFL